METITNEITKEDLPNYVMESLHGVAKTEGFTKYTLDVMAGSNVGDGFVAVIVKATIKGIRNISITPSVSSREELIIIAKIPPSNAARRELFGMIAFEREVYAYNVVIPAFVKFQTDRGITRESPDGFFSFPKCYYAHFDKVKDEAIIIMDDIREHGFKMENKYKTVEWTNTKTLMETLGRLHALSFAMKDQCPNEFDKLKLSLKDILGDMIDTVLAEKMNAINMERAINSLCPDNENELQIKLREYEKLLIVETERCVNAALAEPYAVIGHGDSWINNMMFKYDENNYPKQIRLLDWQLCRYGSPVLDIMYFICLCTDNELRASHFGELLQIYYDSMSTFLNRLGSNAATLFPRTELTNQLTKFGQFGFIMAIMVIPLLCTENKDLPDMDKMADDLKSGMNLNEMNPGFQVSASNEDKYNKRMSDLIRDMFKMNLLK